MNNVARANIYDRILSITLFCPIIFKYSEREPIHIIEITTNKTFMLPLKTIKRAIGIRMIADITLKNRLDFAKSTLPRHEILDS